MLAAVAPHGPRGTQKEDRRRSDRQSREGYDGTPRHELPATHDDEGGEPGERRAEQQRPSAQRRGMEQIGEQATDLAGGYEEERRRDDNEREREAAAENRDP